MATATSNGSSVIQQVGEMAGAVWHALDQHGPMTFAKLVRTVGAPRDMVAMGVGWLAREEKLTIEESRRGRIISLC